MLPIRTAATTAVTSAFALALMLASAGCAVGSGTRPANAPPRAAADVPERFMVGTLQPGGALTEPQPNGACRNPMIDPRDGTRLTLVQSESGNGRSMGDYSVAEARYGIGPNEVLRLDCGTGRVIGIVPRRR